MNFEGWRDHTLQTYRDLQPDIVEPLTSPHLDRDGTCRIYYGCPDHANSSFLKPENMADIRHVVLRYHMTAEPNKKVATPYDFSNPGFDACPVWHFVDRVEEVPKPKCSIIIVYDGAGILSRNYTCGLSVLLKFMTLLTESGFEDVLVKVVFESPHDAVVPHTLPDREATLQYLKTKLETRFGEARTFAFAGGDCEMEFRPAALAAEWLENLREGARREYAIDLKRNQEFMDFIDEPEGRRERVKRGFKNFFRGRSEYEPEL